MTKNTNYYLIQLADFFSSPLGGDRCKKKASDNETRNPPPKKTYCTTTTTTTLLRLRTCPQPLTTTGNPP